MSTKSTNARKEGKFVRYMKAPLKILARARDFYIHSLNGCAGQVAYYGSAVSCPTQYNPASLPRSFSTKSSSNPNHGSRDEDMRELVRIASMHGLIGKTKAKFLQSGKSAASVGGGGAAAISRSRTVVMGRIDEDKPCEFEGNDVGEIGSLLYHRSKSYAASGSNRMV